MSRVKLVPYNMGSESANTLARALNVQKVVNDPARSRFRSRPDDIIINWGLAQYPEHITEGIIINHFHYATNASNKLQCFNILKQHDIPIPEYTRDTDEANEWLQSGYTVLGRDLTRGSGGRGISVYEPSQRNPVGLHRYYTKYIPKFHEYRVHVAHGEYVIHKKLRNYDVPDDAVNWRIRSHANGFIFGRNPRNVPHEVAEVPTNAIPVLNLDFGAVDVVYNQRRETAYVLEVNTAPGIEGETIDFYRENISQIISNLQGERA